MGNAALIFLGVPYTYLNQCAAYLEAPLVQQADGELKYVILIYFLVQKCAPEVRSCYDVSHANHKLSFFS